MRLFWIFIISSFCWLSLSSQAQIALLGGTNFCWMRNDNLLPQQEVMVSTHLGISIQYFPFNNAPEISLENGFLTNTKGYHLDIDKDYYFRLHYYSFSLLLNYSVSEQVTLSTGLEFNYLNAPTWSREPKLITGLIWLWLLVLRYSMPKRLIHIFAVPMGFSLC